MTTLQSLRQSLSPLAADALDAAESLGCAGSPAALYAWACRKSVDVRLTDERRAAALEICRALNPRHDDLLEWKS